MSTETTEHRQNRPATKIRSYAVSARAIRMTGRKLAQDPQKAREFLISIGVAEEDGSLAAGFR